MRTFRSAALAAAALPRERAVRSPVRLVALAAIAACRAPERAPAPDTPGLDPPAAAPADSLRAALAALLADLAALRESHAALRESHAALRRDVIALWSEVGARRASPTPSEPPPARR